MTGWGRGYLDVVRTTSRSRLPPHAQAGRGGAEAAWVLGRRDTRGKRGYDGSFCAGMTDLFCAGMTDLFCAGVAGAGSAGVTERAGAGMVEAGAGLWVTENVGWGALIKAWV